MRYAKTARLVLKAIFMRIAYGSKNNTETIGR
jgi:hypothetical protein